MLGELALKLVLYEVPLVVATVCYFTLVFFATDTF